MLIILKWDIQSNIIIFIIVYENRSSVWRFGTLSRSFAMECEHQQLELQYPGVISTSSFILSFARSTAVTAASRLPV